MFYTATCIGFYKLSLYNDHLRMSILLRMRLGFARTCMFCGRDTPTFSRAGKRVENGELFVCCRFGFVCDLFAGTRDH